VGGALTAEKVTVVEFAPVCVFEILAELDPEVMSAQGLALRMDEMTEWGAMTDSTTADAVRSVRSV